MVGEKGHSVGRNALVLREHLTALGAMAQVREQHLGLCRRKSTRTRQSAKLLVFVVLELRFGPGHGFFLSLSFFTNASFRSF